VLHGNYYPVQVEDERQRKMEASLGRGGSQSGEVQIKAPMPGLVVAIPVSEGQEVQKGDVLVILESMKMQNEIKSPRAGKVNRIRIKPGDSVEQKQPLLSIA
jgi:biotin carboxyl carrier protein